MGIMKSYVKNRSQPEGCIIEGYASEEVVERCVYFIDSSGAIGVPISQHEGHLAGKGTIRKKTIDP